MACAPAQVDDDNAPRPCSASDAPTHGRLSAVSTGSPTSAEQVVLERLNRARQDPVAEASRLGIALDEGTSPPLLGGARPPLAMNPQLLQAARAHSEDMLTRNFFDHTNPDGDDPFDRMQASGYSFAAAGENLHIVMASAPLSPEEEAPAAHDDLFVDQGYPGRGHRLNIVDADFTEVGIGLAAGTYRNGGSTYQALTLTQDFGRPLSGTRHYVIGVVYQDDDGNGQYDGGEGMASVRIAAHGDEFWTTDTGAAGDFAFAVEETGEFELHYSVNGQDRCQRVEVDAATVQASLILAP
ncbi:MAG: CAP domain-containing protein [Pseudomonadota bacterium]